MFILTNGSRIRIGDIYKEDYHNGGYRIFEVCFGSFADKDNNKGIGYYLKCYIFEGEKKSMSIENIYYHDLIYGSRADEKYREQIETFETVNPDVPPPPPPEKPKDE